MIYIIPYHRHQICNSETDFELQDVAMDNIDILIDSGYVKPITKLGLDQRGEIVKMVALHKVIKTSLAELTQFREGLYKVEKIQEVLTNHSELLEIFYCLDNQQNLTAGKLY